MRPLFVVNPNSGLRRRRNLDELIRGACAIAGFEITTCVDKDDLDAIVGGARKNGFDAVFAVGGDGTVHEIAKRLIGTDVALGILPVGSGNGLARHLGIPLRAKKAVAVCSEGMIATVDTATVNGEPFIGVMGVGLDAVIAERFASSAVRGLRTYVRIGLGAFGAFKTERYEIEVDGVRSQHDAFVVAVANSSQYGNNARIAPLASLQDGVLDVVVIEDVSFFLAPFLLLRLFNGTFHESPRVKIIRGREIRMRRSRSGAAHIDGEPIELPAELHVRVRPQSLRVVLPGTSDRI